MDGDGEAFAFHVEDEVLSHHGEAGESDITRLFVGHECLFADAKMRALLKCIDAGNLSAKAAGEVYPNGANCGLMKNVILWGDSIRQGYGPFVAAELDGVAAVSWPNINCENSTVMLANWQSWLGATKPDVLHFNCGLHDVKTVSPRRRDLVVPLEFYRRNLEILLEELRFALPDTRLIFATTTPVVESLTTSAGRIFHRYNANVEAFNDAAREIATRHDVKINDLWQVVQTRDPQTMINADGVHYDAKNSCILGAAVAGVIAEELK